MIFLRLREVVRSSPGRRDKIVVTSLVASLVINIILWALTLYTFWQATDFIVLRYSVYFGISALGPWYYILFLPLAGLVILILNVILALGVYMRSRFLSYTLAVSASLANLAFLVAVSFLVYINI